MSLLILSWQCFSYHLFLSLNLLEKLFVKSRDITAIKNKKCIKTADVLLKIVNDLKKLNEDFLIQEVKNVFLVQYDYEYTNDRLWYIFTEVR